MQRVDAEEDFFLYTFTDYFSLSPSEIDREIEREWIREKATRKIYKAFYEGALTQGDWDEFLALLAEHEIDPYEWCKCLIDNIDFITRNNEPVTLAYTWSERVYRDAGVSGYPARDGTKIITLG